MATKDPMAEIARLRGELKKHAEDDKMVVKLLKLVGGIDMSRELLKETGIGKTVNKLATDPRSSVREAAEPILKKWKAIPKPGKEEPPASLGRAGSNGSLFDVGPPKEESGGEESSSKEGAGEAGAGAGAGAGEAGPPGSARRSSNASAGAASSSSGPVERLSSPLARIPMPSDPVRVKTVELFAKLFSDLEVEQWGRDAINNAATHIERAMTEALGTGTTEYKQKYRTLKTNLGLNLALKPDLLAGHLDAARLVAMTDKELMSADQQAAIHKANSDIIDASRQDWLDANREQIMKAVGINLEGGLFKCGRCGSSKTTHYQKQTRSADEPMTVFIQCTKCPNRWRQY
jgi:transcription elongation factor S-II